MPEQPERGRLWQTPRTAPSGTYRGKRALDLLVASGLLVLSLPVQAVVALFVRARLGAPVLFRQERPGLGGQPFELVKFRTMRPVDAERGWTDNASRHTKLGRFLRATSLDELPSLLNVMRGDMSMVGPRPLLVKYLDRYTPEQARRHEARPGLTGLAQVSGRNAISWEDKFRLDTQYVDHCSLALDVRILAMTAVKVLGREGINSSSDTTMPEFMGNRAPR